MTKRTARRKRGQDKAERQKEWQLLCAKRMAAMSCIYQLKNSKKWSRDRLFRFIKESTGLDDPALTTSWTDEEWDLIINICDVVMAAETITACES